jgi:SET domain-containing protein
MIRPGIYIDESAGKGRGVFTSRKIAANAVVETSPVIVMDEAARLHLDKTPLHDYIFEWLPTGKNWCCMAMGYVPVYNHSYASNCEYLMDYEAATISIIAMRDIEPDTELTINYNGDWDDKTPIWFDAG